MSFLNAFSALSRILAAVALACIGAAILFTGTARIVLLSIVLTLGVTGLVFVGVGSRLGRVSSLDGRLRATGISGTATITSLGEIGVTANGSPVIEFGLEVDSTAHAPFSTTIRQRAPRPFTGAFLPGAIVAVRVNPTDREHLAIDWESYSTVQPSSESLATPAVAVSPSGRVRDAEDLLRTGRHATAVVTSMEYAGDMSELGLVEIGATGDDDRLFVIGLEVKQARLDPYEVRVSHWVPERLLGRVGPRTRVDVVVDRDDSHSVAIDWNSLRR